MSGLTASVIVVAFLTPGADPKPSTRATAETQDANLKRYKLGGFGENANGTLGIEVKYPDNSPQGITISSFKVDSTAKKAGLEEYQWILEVDGAAVGKIRGRYYEPWSKYGRAGEITQAELLVSYLKSDGKRVYYYPKVELAGVTGTVKAYQQLPEDFFTVKKPTKEADAESQTNNFARYKIGAGNFDKYARFELGATVQYSYESGGTIKTIKAKGAAEKAGLKVGDMILEVDGAPVGVFGDRTYEIWRQYVYSKDGVVELLVCFKDPASGQFKYYYPKVQLDKHTTEN